jgi:hypothetical protein
VIASARKTLCAGLVLAAIASPACGGDGDGGGEGADYTANVDNPLVPLASVPFTVLEGRAGGAVTRSTNAVLGRTTVIDGVRVAIVDNNEFEDGTFVEHTIDYFAQRRDGSVWFFGEEVDNIEKGKIDHEGQWLAGVSGAKPGLYMPAHPKVGQVFDQERAPGVAEDRSTVLSIGLTKRTPAGTFRGCIKMKDFDPIEDVAELKYYCAGIGLVHEHGRDAHSDLTTYRRGRPARTRSTG